MFYSLFHFCTPVYELVIKVGGEIDDKVTRQEFENYYFNVSAAIDRDEYFEIMIRNAWHFSGLESWSTSSSNPRRYIGVRPDGTEYIEEGPRTLESITYERSARYGPSGGASGFQDGYRADGPRADYRSSGAGPRSSPGRSGSPLRSSSPPPASYVQGRTDRPLNF
jgi:hypothetical protein